MTRPDSGQALTFLRSPVFKYVTEELKARTLARLLKTSSREPELLQSAKQDLEALDRIINDVRELAETR